MVDRAAGARGEHRTIGDRLNLLPHLQGAHGDLGQLQGPAAAPRLVRPRGPHNAYRSWAGGSDIHIYLREIEATAICDSASSRRSERAEPIRAPVVDQSRWPEAESLEEN